MFGPHMLSLSLRVWKEKQIYDFPQAWKRLLVFCELSKHENLYGFLISVMHSKNRDTLHDRKNIVSSIIKLLKYDCTCSLILSFFSYLYKVEALWMFSFYYFPKSLKDLICVWVSYIVPYYYMFRNKNIIWYFPWHGNNLIPSVEKLLTWNAVHLPTNPDWLVFWLVNCTYKMEIHYNLEKNRVSSIIKDTTHMFSSIWIFFLNGCIVNACLRFT